MMTQPTADRLSELLEQLERLPIQLEHLVTGLTPARLTTHFLAGEWSVAQNIHHLADSHMNAYVRCKLILTEDDPPLKPYDQDRWATLPDAADANAAPSLSLLRALHHRWIGFFSRLDGADWARTGRHPEHGAVSLADQLRLYAGHGLAHIDQIRRTLAAQYAAPPATKIELLERIDHEWDAVNRLLVFLAPEQFDAPLDSGWSPKQHMAHLTAWERYLVTNVMEGQPGHAALGSAGRDYTHVQMDLANAAFAADAARRSFEEIQAAFIAMHTELHQRLERLTWAEMMRRPAAGAQQPLIEQIIANTYDHYLEHWLALPVV